MIASCGEALIDFVRDPMTSASRWTQFAGGSPYNVARGLGRLGIGSAFVGAISTDFFGEELVAGLNASGVATDYVLRLDRPSTLSFVSLDQSDGSYAFYSAASADRHWRSTDDDDLLASVEALHFGSNSLVLEPAATEFERLMALAKPSHLISFDPNVRIRLIENRGDFVDRFYQLVAYADIVKLSGEDLEYLDPGAAPSDMAKRIFSCGASLVVVTSGAQPATAFTPNSEVTRPAVPVRVVDTIGAGDGFMAGLLASLSRYDLLSEDKVANMSIEDLEGALDVALRVAAAVCARRGAEMPTMDDLDEIGRADN